MRGPSGLSRPLGTSQITRLSCQGLDHSWTAVLAPTQSDGISCSWSVLSTDRSPAVLKAGRCSPRCKRPLRDKTGITGPRQLADGASELRGAKGVAGQKCLRTKDPLDCFAQATQNSDREQPLNPGSLAKAGFSKQSRCVPG
jgi:hypothetical protein